MTLEKVPWLTEAGELARAEVMARAVAVTFEPGQALMVELEAGDDLFIITEGRAAVSVSDGRNQPHLVGELSGGEVCGELSLLTREVRSASVIATTRVHALRLNRDDFERVLVRHPVIGAYFARMIAARIADTRARLHRVANPSADDMKTVRTLAPSRGGQVVRAWREVVHNHGLELPMRALLSFMGALLLLRGFTQVTHLGDAALLSYLRVGYTSGFVLVFAATAVSLLRFRRSVQRWVAIALGLGLGAIVNGLSVFLAFDMFYLDMTNRDPNLPFSVETLYRRNDSEWAVLIIVFGLLQLAFLRRFYRRLWLLARARF